MRKTTTFLFIFLVLVSFAYAVTKETQTLTTTGNSLVIVYPQFYYLEQDSFTIFPFDILNSTLARLDDSTTDCIFFVVNHSGGRITNGQLTYDNVSNYWNFNLNTTHTAKTGTQEYYIHCNSTNGQYGFAAGAYEITPGGEEMTRSGDWLPAIVLIPLMIAFLLLFWAAGLDDVLQPLKWFMRFLALLMVMITYAGAHMIINLYPAYAGLAGLFDFFAYGWIFWTILGVFLVYVILFTFYSFQKKKEKDFEGGIIR